MAHLFTFTSSQFRQDDERANPINPIAGEGALKWLAARLGEAGFTVGEVDAEDWGWYTDVTDGPRTYLLGSSGEWGEEGEGTEWMVQLVLNRSSWEKLTGANRMTESDPVSAAIEAILRENPEFSGIVVDRAAR